MTKNVSVSALRATHQKYALIADISGINQRDA